MTVFLLAGLADVVASGDLEGLWDNEVRPLGGGVGAPARSLYT